MTPAPSPTVLTFPHMDHLSPVIGGLFESLGCAFVAPPGLSERTRQIGRRLGREGFCQPLNNNIGDIASAIERGANAVVYTAGHDPCRYGFYWVNQKVIIEDHFGFEVPFYIIDHLDPRGSVEGILDAIGCRYRPEALDAAWQATMHKIDALADLSRDANRIRARERDRGQTTRAYRRSVTGLLAARTMVEIEAARAAATLALKCVALRTTGALPKVLLVGAIYEVLEPSANYHIEELLAALGVEVERSLSYHDLVEIFSTDAHQTHMDIEARVTAENRRLLHPDLSEVGYGGYGRLTIGHAARARADGFDGIVHLHSFSCMPEIVAKPFIKQISVRDAIPAMTICVEEIASPELFRSRLEAFVDLVLSRRAASAPSSGGNL